MLTVGRHLWVGLFTGFLSASLIAADSPPAHSLGAPDRPAPSLSASNGVWWFVHPDGTRFVSRGISVATQGTAAQNYDPENPSYAAWKQYPSPAVWAESTLARLTNWGFNTLGGWGDYDSLRSAHADAPWITPVLHAGASAGAPWWDMWDPRNVERMEDVVRDQVVRYRNDPRLLGYYSDNELGWWNATLWKLTLEQPPGSGQRQRLIRLLRSHYNDDWAALCRDFDVEQADGWRQLQRGGALFVKPGRDGVRVLRLFLGILAERYYGLMRTLIRKYDSRALFLGDRFASFYYPEVAQACARHVDVVSMNLNPPWNDGSFPRFQVQTLHELTRKPILISETYLAAHENRTGNRNSHGYYPVARTQAERATAAVRTLDALFRLPSVVGVDWFQLFDEPRHGRDDGENFNFGLVDIHDVPYEPLVNAFARFIPTHVHAEGDRSRPSALQGVPPAPADPLGRFQPGTALLEWDRERGFVPPQSSHPLADLYLCWNPRALFLGLFTLDIAEPALYRGASVPKTDRALLIVSIAGREVARVRLGAGREPIMNDPRIRVENLSGFGSNVRNFAALEIPGNILSTDAYKEGEEIDIAVRLHSHADATRTEWAGRFRLRGP